MGTSMQKMSDQLLVETYTMAVKVKCDEAFIQLLMDEINRRGILIYPSNKWSGEDQIRDYPDPVYIFS